MHYFPVAVCLQIYIECACQVWGFINILGSFSVYLQHLQSWCLQRSTQTKGGEQWCFLQASEEQPMETPFEVTTWSSSEVSSRSRGIERLLNLTSRTQPGTEGEKKKEEVEKYEKTRVYNTKRCTKTPVLRQHLLWTHLRRSRGVYSKRETYEDTQADSLTHLLTNAHASSPATNTQTACG